MRCRGLAPPRGHVGLGHACAFGGIVYVRAERVGRTGVRRERDLVREAWNEDGLDAAVVRSLEDPV